MRLTNKQIFSDSLFQIPRQRGDKEFLSFLEKTFREFKKKVRKFSGGVGDKLQPLLPLIDWQSDVIIESIDLYFRGFTSQSYLKAVEVFTELDNEGLLPIQSADHIRSSTSFYRIRISENYSLSKKELFHIPFDLRERVNTQRFSIPGLPCLYLGDSIYVCWEELNRPPMEKMHIVRCDLSKSSFNFLLLNTTSLEVYNKCFKSNPHGNFLGVLNSFLVLWPTLFTCSLHVYKADQPFKPEYVFPQHILQWILSKEGIDGILYKSNKVSILNSVNNIGSFSNLAIPVRSKSSYGFCPILLQSVMLTTPISWSLLDIAGNPEGNKSPKSDQDLKSNIGRISFIELLEGERSHYANTKFGMLEKRLKTMRTALLVP